MELIRFTVAIPPGRDFGERMKGGTVFVQNGTDSGVEVTVKQVKPPKRRAALDARPSAGETKDG